MKRGKKRPVFRVSEENTRVRRLPGTDKAEAKKAAEAEAKKTAEAEAKKAADTKKPNS